MKKAVWIVIAAMLLTMLAACGTSGKGGNDDKADPVEKTKVNVVAIAGPTGVGLANLWAESDADKTDNDYNFTLVTDPQQAVAAIMNGSADIAAVPTNLAAVLYQKTSEKVQVLAGNTGGVLYVIENGNTIQSMADLKGKTVYSTGQGANPEYIMQYLLEENELTDEVKMEFLAENTEMATLLVNGTAKVALVPEPLATTVLAKNKDLRVALSINDEWNAVADENLLMGCVIARTEFIEQNPKAVELFLDEYKDSIDAATADVEKTAGYCETYKIIASAAIAKQAIPRCELTFVTGADLKAKLVGFYEVFFAVKPQALGGKMPADGFYYGVR